MAKKNLFQCKFVTCLLSFILVVFIDPAESKMKVLYEWSQLEFDYESDAIRQRDIDSGVFNVGGLTPVDADVYFHPDNSDRTIFITIPRFQRGVAATFGTVSNRTYNRNPVIIPYPSWRWHRNLEQCHPERLVSVYRVDVDQKCNRLWIMDSGSLAIGQQTCRPQILAFDLTTNKLISRYELPSSQYVSNSILAIPIVDVRDTCEDVFVYIGDITHSSLVVYDFAANDSWNIIDKTFYPYPEYAHYKINGTEFDLMDGLYAMTLGPYHGNDRKLYYHALSSHSEQWVLTSHIRNKDLYENSRLFFGSHPEYFHRYPRMRHTHSAAEAMDSRGMLYFSLVENISIACWNSYGDYLVPGSWETVAADSDILQFLKGMKVRINNNGQEELWTMSTRFQKLATGTLNPAELNFRILSGNIRELTENTVCAKRKYSMRKG